MDRDRRETVTTIPYERITRPVEPIGKPTDPGAIGETTQVFRTVEIEFDTKQAYEQKTTKVKINLVPIVKRMKNNVVVFIADKSDLNNETFVKKKHWTDYFLDNIQITYKNRNKGWSLPEWGPKSINREGGYNHTTTFGVNVALGFNGRAPQGTAGGGWSQSLRTTATVMDIEFTVDVKNGRPTFNWKTAQAYDGIDKPVTINDNWWNMIRKDAEQVSAIDSVFDAPNLAKSSFTPVSYSAWQPKNTSSLPTATSKDMSIIVDYSIGYRKVHSTGVTRNEGDNWLRAFSFLAGLDPNMYGGEAFRSWSTSVIRHEFQVEIIIPKDYLTPLTE